MRKFLCLLLSLTILASLTACRCQPLWENWDNITQDDAEVLAHTGKKYDQKIVGSSIFSEGVAFVAASVLDEKISCIDKNGYILFEIEINENDIHHADWKRNEYNIIDYSF